MLDIVSWWKNCPTSPWIQSPPCTRNNFFRDWISIALYSPLSSAPTSLSRIPFPPVLSSETSSSSIPFPDRSVNKQSSPFLSIRNPSSTAVPTSLSVSTTQPPVSQTSSPSSLQSVPTALSSSFTSLYYSQTLRSLIAGGIAGSVAKTFTAPLDRVKILFQGSNPLFRQFTYSLTGPFRAVAYIYRQEGLLACYKGHLATLVRIFPYSAINFYCYETYKKFLIEWIDTNHSYQDTGKNAALTLVSGSLAGMTSVLFTYPLDYVHSRITYQVKIKRYSGIWQTIRSTLQEGVEEAKVKKMIKLQLKQELAANSSNKPLSSTLTPLSSSSPPTSLTSKKIILSLPHFFYGIRTLYRGFGPTVLGIIPYAGVSFTTYDTLKKLAYKYSLHTNEGEVPVSLKLLCGACAGAAAQTASYPLDVIRRRMQLTGLSSSLPHYRNSIDALIQIIKREGIRGLYIGLSINYVKVGPAHAISFVVYEFMKKNLGVQRGKHGL